MFRGNVIHGDGVGKTMGYPTANLDISTKKTNLKDGIYAVHATLGNKTYKAAAYIHSVRERVEIFLIDYTEGDFYSEELIVDPIQKVSEVVSVQTEQELKEKIAKDIMLVKQVFNGE